VPQCDEFFSTARRQHFSRVFVQAGASNIFTEAHLQHSSFDSQQLLARDVTTIMVRRSSNSSRYYNGGTLLRALTATTLLLWYNSCSAKALEEQKRRLQVGMEEALKEILEQDGDGDAPKGMEEALKEILEQDGDSDASPRITGGTVVTDPNAFPSYGLNAGLTGLCGGTLIYPDIVLTAAHCEFPDSVFADGWIQGGILQNGSDGEMFDVEEIFPHPDYTDDPNEYNDIMLLKLASPSSAPLQELNFDPNFPADGTEAIVIGYGATSEGGMSSPDLLETFLDIESFEACNAYYGTIMDDIQICTVSAEGRDACQGDRYVWKMSGFCCFARNRPLSSTI